MNTIDRKNLGRVLKKIRESKRITQVELSSKIGGVQSTWVKIEQGILEPKLDEYFDLCKLFKIHPNIFRNHWRIKLEYKKACRIIYLMKKIKSKPTIDQQAIGKAVFPY